MLELGVVPRILDLLEQHVAEGDVSVQHAGLSALRNLAIPGITAFLNVYTFGMWTIMFHANQGCIYLMKIF